MTNKTKTPAVVANGQNENSDKEKSLARLRELHVDPDLKSLLPKQSQETVTLLTESICREGCRDPIVVDENNNVLEGHTRLGICLKYNTPAEVIVVKLRDGQTREEWIIENQLARRNLNTFQRVEVALKMKKSIAAQAKKKQKESGGTVRQKSAEPLNTRDKLAEMAGVSTDTISKVEYILQHADEETKAALWSGSGQVSINSVYKSLKEPAGKEGSNKGNVPGATKENGEQGRPETMETPNAAPASCSQEPTAPANTGGKAPSDASESPAAETRSEAPADSISAFDFFSNFKQSLKNLQADDNQRVNLFKPLILAMVRDGFKEKANRQELISQLSKEFEKLL